MMGMRRFTRRSCAYDEEKNGHVRAMRVSDPGEERGMGGLFVW